MLDDLFFDRHSKSQEASSPSSDRLKSSDMAPSWKRGFLLMRDLQRVDYSLRNQYHKRNVPSMMARGSSLALTRPFFFF